MSKIRKRDFVKARNIYNIMRQKEMIKIENYLLGKGFVGKSNKRYAGKGKKEFTADGKFEVTNDLSNWKYIELTKNNVNMLVSLQPFAKSSNGKNIVVLYDRIGFYVYKGKYESNEVVENMKLVNLELPLDKSDLSLLELILNDVVCSFDNEDDLKRVYIKHKIV